MFRLELIFLLIFLFSIKCTVLVRLLNFLTITLNDGLWRTEITFKKDIFNETLFTIIFRCIFSPQSVGFDVTDFEVLQKLPEEVDSLDNLWFATYQRKMKKNCKICSKIFFNKKSYHIESNDNKLSDLFQCNANFYGYEFANRISSSLMELFCESS